MSLLLHNIGQLATCPPQHDGHGAQNAAGLIKQAAVLIEGKKVRWAGPESELPKLPPATQRHNCEGRLVIPGLVDCHTHLCFGGWRGDEFAQRIEGATYQDIAAAGGGIRSTVAATRATGKPGLINKARSALDGMLALGVTTVEAKSGYGLNVADEIKQLEVYAALHNEHPVDLVPTFLGAHIVPPEFQHDRAAYIRLLCEELLPRIAKLGLARYCDVFVENSAYSIEEAREILNCAKQHGLALRIHADQLSPGGGAELAAEMEATSAEHLEYISDAGIAAMAKSGTIAVSLPIASLYLGQGYLPARRMIDAGVNVAVATDFNPGSSPSYHLPMALMLACTQQRMSPAEALVGATSIAARAVGLAGKAGSLTTGCQADVAIMDAPDLNHWLYHFRANACVGVIKAGRWQHQP